MGFGQLLGNEQLKENLRESLRKGHISHFYLITGAPGSGKKTLCKLLAMAILCQGEDAPCGKCAACRKVLSGNHPDLITVDDPEKKTVPVDLIRQSRADIFVRPNESEHKIYVFPRAQDMGIPGQNALLKILEEPPSYGVFILIADNPEKLLPTVRSRCTELKLHSLPEDLLLPALRREFPEAEESRIRAAVARSGGYPGQAKQILEAGEDLPEQTVALMNAIAEKNVPEIAQTLCSMERWKRDQWIPMLEQWADLLGQAVTVTCGAPPVLPLAGTLARSRTGADLLRYGQAVRQALTYAQANVSCATVCGYLVWALQ